jgi:pyruvate-formate lyase
VYTAFPLKDHAVFIAEQSTALNTLVTQVRQLVEQCRLEERPVQRRKRDAYLEATARISTAEQNTDTAAADEDIKEQLAQDHARQMKIATLEDLEVCMVCANECRLIIIFSSGNRD